VRSANTKNASASAPVDSQHRSNGPAGRPVRRCHYSALGSARRAGGCRFPAATPVCGGGSGRTRAWQKTCRWLRARVTPTSFNEKLTLSDDERRCCCCCCCWQGERGSAAVLTLRERRSTSQDRPHADSPAAAAAVRPREFIRQQRLIIGPSSASQRTISNSNTQLSGLRRSC